MKVLADNIRRAAHGKHRCGLCGHPIAARESYRDYRIADCGTAYTFRTHLRCESFATEVTDVYDREDGIDALMFADLVSDYRDVALKHGVPSA